MTYWCCFWVQKCTSWQYYDLLVLFLSAEVHQLAVLWLIGVVFECRSAPVGSIMTCWCFWVCRGLALCSVLTGCCFFVQRCSYVWSRLGSVAQTCTTGPMGPLETLLSDSPWCWVMRPVLLSASWVRGSPHLKWVSTSCFVTVHGGGSWVNHKAGSGVIGL